MFYTGTSHFVSKDHAVLYYRDYGYDSVDGLIADGSISIGPPSLQPGQEFSVIDGEGRYQISQPDQATIRTEGKALSVIEEIALLTVTDGKIYLPKQTLKHYAEIKRQLQTSSANYNAKGYFSLPAGIDADDVLAALLGGKALNGKKKSQSFFSPEEVAYRVVRSAGELFGKRVLEPSAGDGALADPAERAGAEVTVVENYPPNVLTLQQKGYDVIAQDFLTLTVDELGEFDVILANPPFTSNADIDHILHMWSFLKPGGILSVMASRSWRDGSQSKHVRFRKFLEENNAELTEVDAGAFKESGTNVGTMHIRIQKEQQSDVDLTMVSRPPQPAPCDQLGFQF